MKDVNNMNIFRTTTVDLETTATTKSQWSVKRSSTYGIIRILWMFEINMWLCFDQQTYSYKHRFFYQKKRQMPLSNQFTIRYWWQQRRINEVQKKKKSRRRKHDFYVSFLPLLDLSHMLWICLTKFNFHLKNQYFLYNGCHN